MPQTLAPDPRRTLWSACAAAEAALAGLPVWRLRCGSTSLGELLDRAARRLLLPRAEVCRTLRHGVTLACPAGFPDLFADLDGYEPETVAVFRRCLQPGMTVVDVGACVGFYSLLAAQLVGSEGKVYAFEPHPALYPYLRRNAAANGFSQIVAVHQAVTNHAGIAPFYVGTRMGTSSLRYHWGLGRRPLVVPTTTLDRFFSLLDWPRVDLIKIDVEGAELSVLDGMQELCRKLKPTAILEFAPDLLLSIGIQPTAFLDAIMRTFDSATALLPSGEMRITGAADTARLFQLLEETRWCNLLCR